MTKLVLAMMCVGLGVGMLAGCASSTMPAPNDPSTAIHDQPLAKADPKSEGAPGDSDSSPSVAAADAHHGKINVAESTTTSK